jgi:predicted dithiol-disulfide oxidoreductase (DUF899 family)
MRPNDLLWPLWGVLDLTPEGRGTGRRPDRKDGSELKYDAEA